MVRFSFFLLLGLLSLATSGCNMHKDHSMRSGSYQARNLKSLYYLDITILKEGSVTPKFYIGDVKLLKGDYRGALQMDNPTFSEDLLVELLDENRELLSEHEMNFWQRPADDDPKVEKLVLTEGVKRRNLTVENVIVPYDRRITWIKLKKQYIRFNQEKIIQELPDYYRLGQQDDYNPLKNRE
ncbi:MAG: hypothetical protein EOM12_02005 [Verrucomicrobiae bacterium]|nr:hypothetical protein [Verrucomicrobiae bacterium]